MMTRTKYYRRRWCFRCKKRRRFILYWVAECFGDFTATYRCSQDPTGRLGHTG